MDEDNQEAPSSDGEGRHWEACYFDPIYGSSSVPDWKFSVLTYQTQGGPLLCEFHILLKFDSTALRYAANHPRWSRDPRPLVLWAIKEMLSRLKVADASTFDEIRKPFGIGNSTNGALVGEYWTIAYGSPVRIHLVNYANTHVTDILINLFETYPQIKPTEEEIETTKCNFYQSRRAEQDELLESQRRARLLRTPGTSSLSIFIDESGDTGFNNNDEFISVAVSLPTRQTDRVRNAIRAVLTVCWAGQTPPDEIHFSRLKAGKLEQVQRFMSLIFRHMVCKGLVYMTPKSYYLIRLSRSEAEFNLAREYPMQIHWDQLRSTNKTAAANWLISYLVDETICHLVIPQISSIRAISVTHDRKRLDWQNEALRKGIEIARSSISDHLAFIYGEPCTPPLTYTCAASETEPCLWLSDWIAWEIQKSLKLGPISTFLKSVLGSITCIVIDENGEKVSVDLQTLKRLHVFPDHPRDISPTPRA